VAGTGAVAPTVLLWGVGSDAAAHGLGAVLAGWSVVGVADDRADRARQGAEAFGTAAVALDDLRAGGPAALGLARPPHVVVFGADGAGALDDLLTLVEAGATVVLAVTLPGLHGRADRLTAASGQLVHGDPTPYAPAMSVAMRLLEHAPLPRLVEVRHLRPAEPDDTVDPVVRAVGVAMVLARVAGAGTFRPGTEVLHGDLRRWRTEQDVEVRVVAGRHAASAPVLDAQVAGSDHVIRFEVSPTTQVEHDGVEVAVAVPPTTPPTIGSLGYRSFWLALVDDLRAGRPAALGAGLAVAAHRAVFDHG
jgi:hypothetical protein